MSLYDSADRAIQEMNRANLKAFNRLKMAKWDEISVIRAVGKTYDDSVERAKRKYYEIAIEAFIVALYQTDADPRVATEMADSIITHEWVLTYLEDPDAVTLYVFLTEADRKKQRLIEALAVSQNRNAEIDRALKNWTKQVAQYADNMVFYARLEAFRSVGIEQVRWVSQDDDRVCNECDDLDNQVFDIDQVPPPPHWGCRCYLVPA